MHWHKPEKSDEEGLKRSKNHEPKKPQATYLGPPQYPSLVIYSPGPPPNPLLQPKRRGRLQTAARTAAAASSRQRRKKPPGHMWVKAGGDNAEIPKWSQNGLKMVPRWSQFFSKMVSKWSPEHLGCWGPYVLGCWFLGSY